MSAGKLCGGGWALGAIVMRMDLRLYDDPGSFEEAVRPVIAADPVRHTTAATVLGGLRAGQRYGGERPVLLAVLDGDAVTGFALATPPFPLQISGLPETAVPGVVRMLAEREIRIDGVHGPEGLAGVFVDLWSAMTGAVGTIAMRLRLYRLGMLAPPEVSGHARAAGPQDAEVVRAWRWSYTEEALGEGQAARQPTGRPSVPTDGRMQFWSDGGATVSMAVASRPVHGMCRVAQVYTAPERRGRGYGSAVTAAVTRWALDAGARDIVLYTDLANPTSNSIYQRIGYRPVHDVVEYSCTPAARSSRDYPGRR